jgi:uncharacterized damage-inducible protein DinB
MDAAVLIDLYRLGRTATDAGYYQAAKLFYAAAASLVNQQLYAETLPKSDEAIVAAIAAIEPQLAALQLDRSLLESLPRIRSAISQKHVVAYADAAPIFVCRACGQIAFNTTPSFCHNCGAGQLTYQSFPAIYYLEPESIETALTQLASTPDWLDYLIADLSAGQADQKIGGVEGEWSLREAASHLLDAQQLIAGRVELFMQSETPNLSGKSPSEMVDQSGLGITEIASAFRQSRLSMIDRLRAAPSEYWLRLGQHTEFGPVTLQQQVSYFAKHEHWHMAQMTKIRKAVIS